jgi:hypothetical protein
VLAISLLVMIMDTLLELLNASFQVILHLFVLSDILFVLGLEQLQLLFVARDRLFEVRNIPFQ